MDVQDARIDQETIAAAAPDPEDPQPWTRASGVPVHSTGKGSGRPVGMPLMGLELQLNAEQSAWVRQESQRTGLNYLQVVLGLIDAAREVGSEADSLERAQPTARM